MKLRSSYVLVLLGGSAVACSLLIGSAPEPLSCSQEGQAGPPACDVGLVCRAGTCQSVTPAAQAGAGGQSMDEGAGKAAGGV